MLGELEETLPIIVEGVVQKTLNPTKKINDETEAIFKVLKKTAEQFIADCATIGNETFFCSLRILGGSWCVI